MYYLVKILYNKATAIKPTKFAEPSPIIISVSLAITSPGRNAA